jgi:hypothetical protein
MLIYIAGFYGYYLASDKKKQTFIHSLLLLVYEHQCIEGISYLMKKKGSGTWEKAKRAA